MAAEKKQITRNRISYSCQTCRRRKVKCDKVHPVCGGCQKGDEECVYVEFEKSTFDSASQSFAVNDELPSRKRRATGYEARYQDSDDASMPAVKEIEQKLSQLTALIHQFGRLTPVSNSSPSGSDQANETLKAAHADELSVSSGLYRSLSELDEDSHCQSGSAIDSRSPWDYALRKLEHLNVLLNPGIKSIQQPSNATYHATTGSQPTLAPSALDRAHQASVIGLLSQPDPASNTASLERLEGRKEVAANDILGPSKEESNVLFRSWLWSNYPVYPIFSPQLILRKFNAFNQWHKNGIDFGLPNPDPSFMPFVYLIWYTGMTNLSDKGWQRWFPWAKRKSVLVSRLHVRLEQYLENMKAEPLPSLYSLAAAVIYQSMTLGTHDVINNFISVTLTVRVAQSLGLHIEKPSKQLNEAEAETRRRLWWEIMHLDTSLSTASNMPVVMDECYTDTKMVRELKQSALGTSEALEYEKHLEEKEVQPARPDDPSGNSTASLNSVYHLVARARYALVVATKRLLKTNMKAQPVTTSQMKDLRKSILEIGEEVRATIDRIQTRGIPELDFTPENNSAHDVDHLDTMGDTLTQEEIENFLRDGPKCNHATPIAKHHRTATIAFHKWARIYLSMMIDGLECISYAPFLKNSKSRLWTVARNCALKSCHGFMRKFTSLAKDPQLRRFRWAWPCLYQPMHATIILLVDLHDRPHSDEAPRSRALIDQMFSLLALSKSRLDIGVLQGSAKPDPLREGGSEVWVMLRQLRRMAWQKAGLDPVVLWSEEDQVAVGVGKPLDENELFIRSLREGFILNHKKRQARQETNSRALNEGGMRSFLQSASYENARRQYLHPSEVVQGEQLNGPILQELAELGLGKKASDVLLLRARRDQELMPFAVGSDGREYIVLQDGSKDEAPQQEVEPRKEGQTIDIGELIRKIRDTKQQRTHSESHTASTNPNNDMPSSFSHGNGDWRTSPTAENQAYLDLLDRHSEPQIYSPPSTTTINQTSQSSQPPPFDVLNSNTPSISQTPHSAFHPFASSSQFANGINGKAPTHRASSDTNNRLGHYRQRRTPIANDSYPLAASIPPIFHNTGLTRSSDIPMIFNPSKNESQSQPESASATIDKTYVSQPVADAGLSGMYDTEMEFDWERWDKLFGHFDGLEDVLLDAGAAELNDAETDHVSSS